ncbi:MAG: DUF6894 family protein [Allosphingosinicella sp.]|jgi:hypothetical protein
MRSRLMPRFYLHLSDGDRILDEDGMIFDNLDGARNEAVRAARDIMSDQVRRGFLSFKDRIEIVGEDGQPLLDLPFREAVRIEE